MSDKRSGWAIGFTFFAGVMMIMVGIFDMIEGLAAVFKKDFYAVTPNYVFHFNTSTWGWIHMLLGLVILLAGFGVFAGAVWARTVGVIMAVIVGSRELRVHPDLPDLLDRDRSGLYLRDLGAHGSRARRGRVALAFPQAEGIQGTNEACGGGCRFCMSGFRGRLRGRPFSLQFSGSIA